MLLKQALHIAGFAKNNPDLISNHSPYVPDDLKRHREDILFCLGTYKQMNDTTNISRAERDLKDVNDALLAYV